LFVKLFGSDTWFKLFGGTYEETNSNSTSVEQLIDKDNKNFIEKVREWMSPKSDAASIEGSSNGGLLTSNTTSHNENRDSVHLY
jgi:hypothetical protein